MITPKGPTKLGVGFDSSYSMVNCHITMGNGHRNIGKPLKMVVPHSYVKLPSGIVDRCDWFESCFKKLGSPGLVVAISMCLLGYSRIILYEKYPFKYRLISEYRVIGIIGS